MGKINATTGARHMDQISGPFKWATAKIRTGQ
jgi:hypothetical protein